MAKKSAHPDRSLFLYLGRATDEDESAAIEAHLSACDECASVAALVRVMKEAVSETETHPDVSELASFFYSKAPSSNRSRVAAHVATCSSCATEIGVYARADRAASAVKAPKAARGDVPARAWEMICDWEDSSFAKLKPASEVLGQELLDRLTPLLDKRNLNEMESGASRLESAERVPVLIVTSSGEVRGVEFFEREVDSTGASVLKHSEGSARFDNKPLHALFDFGENSLVVSTLIRQDTIRLEQARPEEQSRRANYIIIED